MNGLTQAQVKEKIAKEGYNEVPQSGNNFLKILLELILEPMVMLLVISVVIYISLGDIKEAMLIGFSVLMVISITLFQEQKTQKSLEALKELSKPFAQVIREKTQKTIPAREVVTEDILILSEGDRVPADALILSCTNFTIDESILTGESVPVEKCAQKTQKYTKQNIAYSGTLVTKGQAYAKVIAIGSKSAIGKIGQSLNSIDIEKTQIQKEISILIKYLAFFAIIFCIILAIIYYVNYKDILNSILAGITLAIGALPEELPIALTLFLAIGAWRLSLKKVLARRMSAIETLGSCDILCIDKTGTITQNKMYIEEVFSNNKTYKINKEIPPHITDVIFYGKLASSLNPYDPLDVAFHNSAKSQNLNHRLKLIREYPFKSHLFTVVNVYDDKNKYLIAAKGSPEAIIKYCKLPSKTGKNLEKQAQIMAENGYRVIAIAKGNYDKNKPLPEKRYHIDFQFLGFVGLIDPVRPTIKDTIQTCFNAGIRTILITGDYPQTAINIAKTIGLKNPENYIRGDKLETLNKTQLKTYAENTNVFARVMPDQKLKIIKALKNNKHVVGMTGDGVNDAPALKAANIGIAMGKNGTDVARESASLVLLNDNFSSITDGIRLGRRIYNNLQKSVSYIFAVHVPIIGLSILPILFGMPTLLFPAHIVFLELIIDPTCTLAFESEPEHKSIMNEKPRDIKQPIFSKKNILFSIIQGLSVFMIIFLIYGFCLQLNLDINLSRTITFVSLVIGNLILILVNISNESTIHRLLKPRNPILSIVSLSAVIMLLFSIYVPVVRNLFNFSSLDHISIIFITLGLLIIFAILEIIKSIQKSFSR